MCGIAGFVDAPGTGSHPAEPARDSLTRMCDAIRHRGPDEEGTWVGDGVALGMRRLSIIDLATGQQPIFSENGQVCTVFNGEIYNFRELRAELSACGHHFRSASDTEVIVHGYEEWGADVVSRLRGMFGLAVWDARDRSLLVARDRMGIKPLYVHERGGRLAFASEIKSLLALPGVPRELDPAALDHYLSFLYTPRDGSIFAGIRKLPPGHLLEWRDGTMRVRRYWDPPASETFTGSPEEAVEALHDVLRDAVRSHMVSDVPLGAFLSGGIDSSVVVALMAQAGQGPVRTFSIGFAGGSGDERPYAREVARRYGTEHHEFVVEPDALRILDALVSHFDEPFGDASAIPTWYVSELARRHVTVALSGDGGDELFGGYERYLPHPRVAAFDRWSPPGAGRLAGAAAAILPRGARGRAFLRHVAMDPQSRYVDDMRFFGPDDKAALLTSDLRGRLRPAAPEARLHAHFTPYAHLPWASQMMHVDADTYLPEDVLVKVDRMSMAHSLESRVPLLDNHVVDFAATLPASRKIQGGRRKHVLKEVAARLLPAALIDRKKRGFSAPLGAWFRGGTRELFADTLLSRESLTRGYFEPAAVRRLVDEHLHGRRDHTLRLWQLIVFERWHALYLGTPGTPLPQCAPNLPLDAVVGAT
ncbi:MAG: asparagine synthase (glutamine-hydrolyzing) [Vicinamibacterales bacterium]